MDKSLWNWNTRMRQMRILGGIVGILLLVFFIGIVLLRQGNSNQTAHKTSDRNHIIDESLTQSIAESAMVIQQGELESLKVQMAAFRHSLKEFEEAEKKEKAERILRQKAIKEKEVQSFVKASQASLVPIAASNWQKPKQAPAIYHAPHPIHHVSFRAGKVKKHPIGRDPKNYVPANTSVRAVILGGADADASVNGQVKNNGVMLFKLLEEGTLPNGQHSRLRGCRVSGNAYGDISSERAFATLYKLSCAHHGESIVDKEVTGWVFFNGKIGVKGVPLMRDNKVLQWAGVSGALTGLAEAAQYAQSVQQFAAYGATSVVPSARVAPYAGFGGASKASDVLSQYYVKRAEQYHPVIQVGAGNIVTIVFKDGFFLNAPHRTHKPLSFKKQSLYNTADFNVPPELLDKLESTPKAPWQAGGASS